MRALTIVVLCVCFLAACTPTKEKGRTQAKDSGRQTAPAAKTTTDEEIRKDDEDAAAAIFYMQTNKEQFGGLAWF